MVFPILDADALIINENDVTTFYGRPTYYYRGAEIGHRQYVIKKFRALREVIFQETEKNIIEVHLITTMTGGTQIKFPCGSLTYQPSPKPGYNVCARVKFADGTFGSGNMWVYHRRSTTTDGAAVYCAKHFTDEALTNPIFRKALVGAVTQNK